MVYKDIKDPQGETLEELLRQMFEIPGLVSDHPGDSSRARANGLAAAIRKKIWDQQFHTIAETRKEFIDQTSALRGAIDEFRKSTERSSRALNYLTFVITIAAVLNVGIFIYRMVCP